MATPVGVKASFIDRISNVVHLDFVLKAIGVIVLVVTFFYAWHHVSFLQKIGFVVGPIAWFVGERFNKIYR